MFTSAYQERITIYKPHSQWWVNDEVNVLKYNLPVTVRGIYMCLRWIFEWSKLCLGRIPHTQEHKHATQLKLRLFRQYRASYTYLHIRGRVILIYTIQGDLFLFKQYRTSYAYLDEAGRVTLIYAILCVGHVSLMDDWEMNWSSVCLRKLTKIKFNFQA